jgi:hypothetical protein
MNKTALSRLVKVIIDDGNAKLKNVQQISDEIAEMVTMVVEVELAHARTDARQRGKEEMRDLLQSVYGS